MNSRVGLSALAMLTLMATSGSNKASIPYAEIVWNCDLYDDHDGHDALNLMYD
jgi:hypothetical protein